MHKMFLLFLIFFLPINTFACYKVRYMEMTEPKIISPMILYINRLVPKTIPERISFFQSIDHAMHPKEPTSLKHQAMRALLKNYTSNEIIKKPLPVELKHQIITQEKLIDEYYKDILHCLKRGCKGEYRAQDNECAFDILNSFAEQEKTSFHFLETIRLIFRFNKELLDGQFLVFGYAKSTVGQELLTKTVKHGNHIFLEWLLKFGVSPHYCDGIQSMLELAIQGDHSEVVEILVSKGVPVNTLCITSDYGLLKSPLRFACTKSKFKAATALIKLGANVNEVNDNSGSILMDSVRFDNSKCVKLLIENGAHIDLQDEKGRTALFYAFDNVWGTANNVDLLIKNGAEVEVKDIFLETPLMHASKACNDKAVGLLLRAGANVNAKDSHERTALFHAFKNDYGKSPLPIVKTLIEHQTDINALDDSGLHVVDHALERYRERRNWGYSTEVDENVLNYLFAQKPKIPFSTRIGVFYHLNRRKIWASAFCATALFGSYIYKKYC